MWDNDHEAIRELAAVHEDHSRMHERIGAFDKLLAHIREARYRLADYQAAMVKACDTGKYDEAAQAYQILVSKELYQNLKEQLNESSQQKGP